MLSILIPMHNEGEIIYRNLKSISSVCNGKRMNYEIIVIDDGSEDNSVEEAKKAALENKRIHIVGYRVNKGKGEALLYGFKHARGDYISFFDADLEISALSIFYLLEKLKANCADAAIFSKNHPSSTVNFPFYRKLLSRGYYLLTKILFRLPVNDTQTGCKVFRRAVLETVSDKIYTKRFAFDLELLVYANKSGFRIIELPIKISFNRQRSRISLRNVLDLVVDTIVIFYRYYILHVV